MNLSLLKEGLMIMSLGMGFVFIFLVIMVLAMNISAIILKKINKIFPEEIKDENKYSKKSLSSQDSDIALAIALAYTRRKEGV